MACARCDFYLPKDSTNAQLVAAKDNLQRMLASIPLTDDERAAVEVSADMTSWLWHTLRAGLLLAVDSLEGCSRLELDIALADAAAVPVNHSGLADGRATRKVDGGSAG